MLVPAGCRICLVGVSKGTVETVNVGDEEDAEEDEDAVGEGDCVGESFDTGYTGRLEVTNGASSRDGLLVVVSSTVVRGVHRPMVGAVVVCAIDGRVIGRKTTHGQFPDGCSSGS